MLESEEDWLYDSISRYKKINMFELEYPVDHLEATSYNSICVSCSNNRRHELLELSLPLKLTSHNKSSSEDVITNDTDLKIKCGTFTQAPVAHMQTLSAGHKAVVSHVNTQGITVYAFSSDNSDEIKVDFLIKCELKGPQLAVSGTELVLTTNNTSPWIVMDLSSGKVSARVLSDQLPSRCEESVSPVYLESRLMAFCHHSTGRVQLYDKRQQKLLDGIIGVNENNSSMWSFASEHEYSEQFTSVDHPICLGMVSTNGTLNLYDSRNWTTPCASKNLGLSSPTVTKNKSPVQLKFKPANKNWMSVSGFDTNVYIYHLTSQLDSAFVHNGHKYVEGFDPDTITTSHAWFPSIDNLIISSADNGTIQSWLFEDSRKLTS
uniref:WD repeat-containing protein 73 n=1 Tax=Cuerna arida TaxID=1464854 RepID=A0A1B6GT96_9HEMI